MTAVADNASVEASLLRALTPAESGYLDLLLERVERQIRRRVPDLDTRVEDEEYRATVSDVESEAIARVFRNPDGYMSEQDGTYSYQINRLVASGLLSITDGEWEMLGAPVGKIWSEAPKTDAYAQQRFGTLPRFQYDFGVGDQMSEAVTEWGY